MSATKYRCPSCGTNDPVLYVRCQRTDCPDGRDPRPAVAPAHEKAAPIPTDVLEAAQSATFDIFGGHFSTYRRAAEVAIARAIMQDRADRASQEERIREDERDRTEAAVTDFRAWYRQHVGKIITRRNAHIAVNVVRARLRGDAS